MNRNCQAYYARNRIRIMLHEARRRAKKLGVAFALETNDITIPTHCPVLGLRLTTEPSMQNRDAAPSIDRMHAELGYVKGNVRIISFRANRMKNNATLEEIAKLYHWMLQQRPVVQ